LIVASRADGQPKMTPVLGCISVFFVLAAVVVLLRLYTRVVLIKRTGGEDYLVAASFVGYAPCVLPKDIAPLQK
jgi:hypothetical protein